MRIVCERCAAAFVVDDERLPVGGARAACPQCRHEVVLRRPDDTSASDAADVLPEVTGRVTARAATKPLPPDPLERDGHVTGQYAVPEPGTRASTGRSTLPEDPLERDGHVTGQYALPDPEALAAAEALSGASSGVIPDAAPPSESGTFAPIDLPAPDTSPAAPAPNPVSLPSTPPPLGEAASPDDVVRPPIVPSSPDDPLPEWRVKKPGGIVEGPFTPLEIVARYEAGLIQSHDLVSKAGEPFQSLAAYPLTAAFLKERHKRAVQVATVRPKRAFPVRAVFLLGVVVFGAALGAVVTVTRPEFLFGPGPSAQDLAARGIVEGWREKEEVPFATSAELYRLAKGYAAADTREGMRRAVDTFKRALLKAPDDLRAMAGYAEARAVLAIEDGDAAGVREASELLAYALRHGGHLPEPHIARANVLVATGSDHDILAAEAEAQTARRFAPDDVDALLAVGRAFLDRNPRWALEALEAAKKVSPERPATHLLLGEAFLRLGRFADAEAAFTERHRLAPDDPTGRFALARLALETGDWDTARARLDAIPARGGFAQDAALLRAVLAYQLEGDLDGAQARLEQLVAGDLDRKRRLRALVHLAAIHHVSDRFEEATRVATSALELDATSAPVHFRLALLALEEGRPEDAEAALAKAAPQMPLGAQRAMARARILAALGRSDEAQAEFGRAMLLEPRNAAPYLLAAALYAQFGAQRQALALVRRSLVADPEHARTHRALTEWFEPSRYLAAAVGGLELLASSHDDIALVQGAVAAARYHAGDTNGAERAARKAVRRPNPALAARLYLARILLDRGEVNAALLEAEAAIAIDRHCAPAQALAGEALVRLGRFDEARRRVRLALEADPNYTPALVRDAEALHRAGRSEEARETLAKAFRADTDDLSVRGLLFEVERSRLAVSAAE